MHVCAPRCDFRQATVPALTVSLARLPWKRLSWILGLQPPSGDPTCGKSATKSAMTQCQQYRSTQVQLPGPQQHNSRTATDAYALCMPETHHTVNNNDCRHRLQHDTAAEHTLMAPPKPWLTLLMNRFEEKVDTRLVRHCGKAQTRISAYSSAHPATSYWRSMYVTRVRAQA
jgi:hypothetical protein